MRIIDQLGVELPGNALLFSRGGHIQSEYVQADVDDLKGRIICGSVACDNHVSGILPTHVTVAPSATIYTKRALVLEDAGFVQIFAHLDESEFLDYFYSSGKLSEALSGTHCILLGGFSWQGLALAHVAQRAGLDAEHLLISDLYTAEEIKVLGQYVEGLGIRVRAVSSGRGAGTSRSDMWQAVDAALTAVATSVSHVIQPASRTYHLAEKLATMAGYPLSNPSATLRALENVTHREIEIFGRIVAPAEVAMALDSLQMRLGNRLQPDVYDVYMLAAQSIEFFAPETL